MKKNKLYCHKKLIFSSLLVLFSINLFAQYNYIEQTSYEKHSSITKSEASFEFGNIPIIDPPMINYINVDSNTSISIAWDQVNDSLNIIQDYSVFYSDHLDSSFQLLGSTTANTFSHSIASAYQTPLFYFVLPNTVGGVPIDTIVHLIDTASSIYLNTNNINDSMASLNWNYVVPNSILPAGSYFKIYRKIGAAVFTIIDSTQLNSYMDTITSCYDTIYYKVGISIITVSGTSNKISYSNISGIFFSDNYCPNPPVIDTVIIDLQTGNAYLYWKLNQFNDVVSHVIWKKVNHNFIPIDTVYGYSIVAYVDSTNSTQNLPDILDYAVSAIDSCSQNSMLSYYIGFRDSIRKTSVMVYPNPAEVKLNFFIDSKKQIKGLVELFSIDGKRQKLKLINGNTFYMDISNLAKGIYFYSFTIENKIIESGRFIKH